MHLHSLTARSSGGAPQESDPGGRQGKPKKPARGGHAARSQKCSVHCCAHRLYNWVQIRPRRMLRRLLLAGGQGAVAVGPWSATAKSQSLQLYRQLAGGNDRCMHAAQAHTCTADARPPSSRFFIECVGEAAISSRSSLAAAALMALLATASGACTWREGGVGWGV